MTLRPAVFLDRDGTLIEEIGYLDRPERIAFYPWTIDAVRALNQANLPVVMVSNQSGIARGFFTEDDLHRIHDHMADMLQAGGARLDAYYYCPHHPDGKIRQYACVCECRKPGLGLVERAARELGIDPRQSFVVGDRWLDVDLGKAMGGRSVLVKTGYGESEARDAAREGSADAIVDNLIAAVSWILSR